MARILTDAQSEQIKVLNRKFGRMFPDWMCEGSDYAGIECNIIFNNDTDEWFKADYNGNILDYAYIKETTSLQDMKDMAEIQGKIRKICEE